MKYATLVGSKTIGPTDRLRISEIGKMLYKLGYVGLSGNCEGADVEWDNYLPMIHYLPWDKHTSGDNTVERSHGDVSEKGRNIHRYLSLSCCPASIAGKAESIAAKHHRWGLESVGRGTRALHTRNAFQVLGTDLKSPTDLVVYVAKESRAATVDGGTATAVAIGRSNKIPTFNLRFDSDYKLLKAILEEALENRVDISETSLYTTNPVGARLVSK